MNRFRQHSLPRRLRVSRLFPWKRAQLAPDFDCADHDAIEEIREELRKQGLEAGSRDVIELALHKMERDLHSSGNSAVIEDVRVELLYRQWLERDGSVNLLQSPSVRQPGTPATTASTPPSRGKA